MYWKRRISQSATTITLLVYASEEFLADTEHLDAGMSVDAVEALKCITTRIGNMVLLFLPAFLWRIGVEAYITT